MRALGARDTGPADKYRRMATGEPITLSEITAGLRELHASDPGRAEAVETELRRIAPALHETVMKDLE
jgi:hypothetical protein